MGNAYLSLSSDFDLHPSQILLVRTEEFVHDWICCVRLGSKIGYDMKMSMTAMVHSKLMKLNSSTMSKITTGHVVNLVSNDVQRFDRAATFWVYIAFGPIETLVALWMVSYVLGVIPTISGFSCIFILIPLQSILSKHVAQFRKKIADISDKRISFLSELISGSLTVKMLALEDPMIEKVNSVRQKEHDLLKKLGYVLGSCNAFYGYVQALMVTITFLVVSIGLHSLSELLVLSSIGTLEGISILQMSSLQLDCSLYREQAWLITSSLQFRV